MQQPQPKKLARQETNIDPRLNNHSKYNRPNDYISTPNPECSGIRYTPAYFVAGTLTHSNKLQADCEKAASNQKQGSEKQRLNLNLNGTI